MNRFRVPRALALSLALHGALLAGSEVWLPVAPNESTAGVVELAPQAIVELMGEVGTSELGTTDASEQRRLVGSFAMARPDLERAGRGGDDAILVSAIHLSVTLDDVTLERAELNHLQHRQQYHEDLGAVRAGNRERAEASVTGDGALPQSGLSHSHQAASSKQEQSRSASHQAGAARSIPDNGHGAPGASIVGDRGDSARSSRAAAVAGLPPVAAFPMLDEAGDARAASARGPMDDRASAAQQVASRERSLLNASTSGGEPRSGRGGTLGDTHPASGGERGLGSKAATHAAGTGNGIGMDAHLMGYVRAVRSQIRWVDAFPVWAIAEGRGGVAILSITIAVDGSLEEVSVLRSSGIGEFDRNLLEAVRKAAPFGSVPERLSRGSLRLRFSFDATNPVVGRQGPGPGSRDPQ